MIKKVFDSIDQTQINFSGPCQPKTLAATRSVLHVINGEYFSGAERVQDLLAINLPAFGYQVGFACLKNGLFADNRQSRNCDLRHVRMRHRLNLGCYRRIIEQYKEGNYRALHAHTPRSLLIAARAAKVLDCPLIYHVHSPVQRDSQRKISNRINTLVESVMLRRVNKMICVSASLRQYMLGLGHNPDRIAVVHNGVDVAEPKTSYWTGSGDLVVGMVALFRPRKGTEVLLHALALAKKAHRPVRLLAVGPFESRDYENELKKLARDLDIEDRVEWTGFEKKVSQRLKQMDLFALPSLYGEGMPMVVLEAMANGIPVIASRVEGTPEAIRDGIDGLLVEPNNAQQLAERLEHIMENPALLPGYGEHALKRQRFGFSAESMAHGVAEVYNELLGD